ncbi:MAG: class I SAM-dependent methyltransferase [Thermoplasmata archaeon]
MAASPLDAPAATRRFVRRILRVYADGELTSMIHLGHVTGLWETLARGAGTSAQIAERATLDERYVREWLFAVAAARIIEFDAPSKRFTLLPARARALAGESIYNLSPGSRMVTIGASRLDRIARAFRTGAGVPYSAYLPEFPEIMEDLNRRRYDALLVSHYLPLARGLVAELERGIRVIDVGTGSGHVLLLLAHAFPRSTFVGIDDAPRPIARARAEAKRRGLANARFLRTDAEGIGPLGRFELATMFDAIHDLSDPQTVVSRLVRALVPGGRFLAVEPRASSDFSKNIGRSGSAFLYGVSTTYCLPVSRAHGRGGLGTCWGTERARRLLRGAGLTSIEDFEAPGNALASVFVARQPGRRRSGPR